MCTSNSKLKLVSLPNHAKFLRFLSKWEVQFAVISHPSFNRDLKKSVKGNVKRPKLQKEADNGQDETLLGRASNLLNFSGGFSPGSLPRDDRLTNH